MENLQQQLKIIINNLDECDKVLLINEYAFANALTDIRLYDMNSFNFLLQNYTQFNIATMIANSNKKFDTKHNYFTIIPYEKLCSINNVNNYIADYIDDIIQYIIISKESFNIEQIKNFLKVAKLC